MVTSSRPNRPVATPRRPTIADVALAAGVSTAVVSYALNGRPGASAATRERVLRVAAELGWRPAAAAAALRRGPRAVGVVVVRGAASGTRWTSMLDVVAAVGDAVAPAGLEIALGIAPTTTAAAVTMRTWWAERRVAAFVVPDARAVDERVSALRRLDAPAVVLGAAHATPACRGVRLDDDAFARVGTFLTDLGHRDVVHLTGSDDLETTPARTGELRRALELRGARLRSAPGDVIERAAVAARSYLLGPEPPTAIVTDDDLAAGVVLDVARRLGLDVPWDLSVVAGTDSPACRLTTPSLTAVPLPVAALGAQVGRTLLDVVAADPADRAATARDADEPGPGPVVVPVGALVVRGSTAPPRSG